MAARGAAPDGDSDAEDITLDKDLRGGREKASGRAAQWVAGWLAGWGLDCPRQPGRPSGNSVCTAQVALGKYGFPGSSLVRP